jgi:hypothetical protein
LLSNHLLGVELQIVHFPPDGAGRLKKDFVGSIAPAPVCGLRGGGVESRILWERRPQRVSQSHDVLFPGSVQRGVQGDGLPVTGREEECRKNHDAAETEVTPDQDDQRSMAKLITYHPCTCIAVDKRYSGSAYRSLNSGLQVYPSPRYSIPAPGGVRRRRSSPMTFAVFLCGYVAPEVLQNQIRDSTMVEAIVELRDARCVRISDGLIVDMLLCRGAVVEMWFTSRTGTALFGTFIAKLLAASLHPAPSTRCLVRYFRVYPFGGIPSGFFRVASATTARQSGCYLTETQPRAAKGIGVER